MLKILHNIAHTHIICNVAEVIINIYCLINGKEKKKPLQLSTAYFNACASILKKSNQFKTKSKQHSVWKCESYSKLCISWKFIQTVSTFFIFFFKKWPQEKNLLIKSKCTENTIRLNISHKIDSHKKKNQEKSVLILKTFKLFIIHTQHLNTSKPQTSNQL